jgi:hypothetical protein
MAESRTVDTIKTIKAKSGNLFTFFATLSGVVVGVVASMAMMGPLLQSQVASATKDLGKTVAIAPASSVAPECVLPAGQAASNQARIATASVPMTVPAPQAGGKGGEAPVPGAGGNNNNKTWVHKFVSGVWATNTATIKNTGADSTNIVKTTNTNTTTVTNKNNVWLSNNNAQKAVSGDVNSYDNTTSGTATSGAAHNTSDADMNVTITN